jgi:hypothetical protein
MRQIALVNRSTHLKTPDMMGMAYFLNDKCRNELLAQWNWTANVVVAPDLAHIPNGAWPIFLLDSNPDPGALGDHEESVSGLPVARIFVPDILGVPAAGILNGRDTSVLSVVDHELCEMAGNPYGNMWATSDDGVDHARELCDAVESSSYTKTAPVYGIGRMSNFVLPHYFNPQPPVGVRFDYMSTLRAPMTIARDGYEIVKRSGTETQHFGMKVKELGRYSVRCGEDMAAWRWAQKRVTPRVQRAEPKSA